MGYLVQTTNNDITIKKENFAKCYEAMCALNSRDDLKSGGSYGGDGVDARQPRPEGMDYHPAKWFAWMPADYPRQYKTFEEIIKALGFDAEYNQDGDLSAIYYDNKTGAEDLFFEAIAKYVEKDSVIDWRGEDGAEWRWFFNGESIVIQSLIRKVWA